MTLQTVWHLALYSYTILSGLFGAYIVVMSLKGARERNGGLHWLEWLLGTPWIIGGHVLDFIGNVLFSIPFLDPPRELTITARMGRYLDNDTGWRRRWARVVCRILSRYDPEGGHCK